MARFLLWLTRQALRQGMVVRLVHVNGELGAIAFDADGQVNTVLSLELTDGRVRAVRPVLNPDKRRLLDRDGSGLADPELRREVPSGCPWMVLTRTEGDQLVRGDHPDGQGPWWNGPVLRSVVPVVEKAAHVTTSPARIEEVAGWMAYEEFAFPRGSIAGRFDFGTDLDTVINVTMLATALNFAFTDFDTGLKFETDYQGRMWSDSEAMFACLHRAFAEQVPILDGDYLASIDRAVLERIFQGTIEMPMLDERVEILNQIGARLVDRHQGRFHRFVHDCAPALYAEGDGLMERLPVEFPRFHDVSLYHGREVHIYKLAQLGLWALHTSLRASGSWALRDLHTMTAFADYIVPVALHVMGILEYSADLERRINDGEEILRDSDEEIEIRAHTLYATALLTDEINRIRPPDLQLVIPQVDHRLWKTYHATFRPHHLTRTIMY